MLFFEKEDQIETATGFNYIAKRYKASACLSCKFKSQCTKSEYRTIQRIEELEKHKPIAYKNLTSEKGSI